MQLSNVSESAVRTRSQTAPREVLEFNKKGLFIGGAAKSGTTLLVSLLDSHPQLVVLPEESSYLEYRPQYRALKDHRVRLDFLLSRSGLKGMKSGRVQEDWTPAVGADVRDYEAFNYRHFASLCRELTSQPWINDSLLFSEVVRAYGITLGANWRQCARWVEKTPRSESFPEELDELFPEAKLIQVVRDPRAVFASRKNRDLSDQGCYAEAHRLTRSWNRSVREVPRLRRDPSRFLVIRYEDLVKNPRAVLEQVCQFGGFEFCEEMLNPTRAGNGWQGNSSFYTSFQGISAAPAEKWKQHLTPREIWWIELHCRRGMELMNYPLETDARFSFGAWLGRLPHESPKGYLRARRDSCRQALGRLKECRFA